MPGLLHFEDRHVGSEQTDGATVSVHYGLCRGGQTKDKRQADQQQGPERVMLLALVSGEESESQRDIAELIDDAIKLELRYAQDTMPRGVLGLNVNMFEEYLHYIANRRCAQIGLAEQYPGANNPFPWMSELIDLKKEKNFFFEM